MLDYILGVGELSERHAAWLDVHSWVAVVAIAAAFLLAAAVDGGAI